MKTFTYRDYLKYVGSGKNALREEGRKYELDAKSKEKTHQYRDKIFKKILSNKKEFIKFLQKYIDTKDFVDLMDEEIEKCNKEFITSEFKKKESDIIYKIANRNTYILVEHQSQIDVCYEQLN